MISLLTIIFIALAGGAVVQSQIVPDCDLDFASLATGLLQAHMDDPLKLSHIEAILSSCNKSRMQKLTEISVYLLHKGTFQTKTMEDIRRLAETLRNERKKRLDQMRRQLPAVLARTMDEASGILMNNTLSGNEKVMSLSNALGSLPREHRQTLEQFFNREATPSQMDPEAFEISKAKEAHQLHGVPIGVDPHGRTEHRKDMTRSFPIEQDSRPFKSTEDSMLQFERLPASSVIRKSDTPPLYDTQDQSMPLKNPEGPVRLRIPPAIYDYNGGGGRLIDVMTKNKRQHSDSTSYMGSFNSPIRPFVSTNGRPLSVGTTQPDLSQMDDADLLNPRTSLLSDAVRLLETTIPMVRPSPHRNRPPNMYSPPYTFLFPQADNQPPQNGYGNPSQATEERSLLPSRDDVVPPSTRPINPINSAKTGMELSTYDTNLGRFAGGVPNSVVLPSASALPARGMESISPPGRNHLVAKPETQRPPYNIYPDHRAGLFPEAVNQAQFERQAERPLKYGGESPNHWETQDNREGALSVKTVIAPAAGRGTVMIENFPPAPYEIAPVPKQTLGNDLLETDRLGSWSMGRFDKEEPRYPTPEPKRDTTTIISVPVETASRSTMYPPATLLEETIPEHRMGPKKTPVDSKKGKKGKNGKDDNPMSMVPERDTKRETKSKDPPKKDPAPQPQQQVPQVAQCAKTGQQVVAKWVQRALDMGVEALRAEYRSLAKYTLPDMTWESFKNNHEAGRNRYQDVPCQDQHRVVLKWPGAPTDYIHANYVGTPVSDKRFICTQGPLDNTVVEFWIMVLQEESETIVMLCNCVETGKIKCSPYWPDKVGDTKTFQGIEITNLQMRPMCPDEPSIVLSILSINFTRPDGNSEVREVRHYQWVDWPDRGVPPCRLTSMELLSRIRGTRKPIIVHCSAGIGRTGTIVAIEYILERMQAGVECASMCDLLKELRNQRAFSIQNDLQYLYIHRVMFCYFLEKHKQRYEYILTEENKAKYAKFVADYNAVTGTQ